jgi:DNA-nicking Smr family endonuclease
MDRESLAPKTESLNKSDRGTRGAQEPFEEPVILPTEDVLDLHAFAPKEIPSVVEEYIEQCREAEIAEVRLIHGKGTGTQRAVVRHLLGSHSGVISFTDAPPEAGGWGATIVRLRTQKASGGSDRSA